MELQAIPGAPQKYGTDVTSGASAVITGLTNSTPHSSTETPSPTEPTTPTPTEPTTITHTVYQITIQNTEENMGLASGETETFKDISIPWSKTISVTRDKGKSFRAWVLASWTVQSSTNLSPQIITVNIYNDDVLFKSTIGTNEISIVCQAYGDIKY
jgi:hypothetical protein